VKGRGEGGGGGSRVAGLGITTKLGIIAKLGSGSQQPTTPITKSVRRGLGGYDHQERGLGVHHISMNDHKKLCFCYKIVDQQRGSLGRCQKNLGG
jgi:hypothetical protein